MRYRRCARGTLLVVFLALVVVGVPSVAAAAGRGVTVITFEEQFTSPTTAAGTWTAVGAISDSGTRTETLTIVPGPNDTAAISGTVEFFGSGGTFTAAFQGTLFNASQPQSFAFATFIWTGGTGEYAGIRGGGTVIATVDQTTGTIQGVDFATVRLRR